jgi:hypothetical protein
VTVSEAQLGFGKADRPPRTFARSQGRGGARPAIEGLHEAVFAGLAGEYSEAYAAQHEILTWRGFTRSRLRDLVSQLIQFSSIVGVIERGSQ